MAGGSQGHEPKKAKIANQHPDAADDAMSPTSSTKCHFTSLPYELCEMIYNELFKDSSITAFSHKYPKSGGSKMAAAKIKENLPFMSSCRMIYEEATPILAKNTTFERWFDGFILTAPKRLHMAYLPHIQRVTLLTLVDIGNPRVLPNLKQVRIHHCDHYTAISVGSLADMVPYVSGDKDDILIDGWINTLDNRAKKNRNSLLDSCWNELKSLSTTVRIQIDLGVYLKMINTSNGAPTRVKMVSCNKCLSRPY